jgi:hypothetical protein
MHTLFFLAFGTEAVRIETRHDPRREKCSATVTVRLGEECGHGMYSSFSQSVGMLLVSSFMGCSSPCNVIYTCAREKASRKKKFFEMENENIDSESSGLSVVSPYQIPPC